MAKDHDSVGKGGTIDEKVTKVVALVKGGMKFKAANDKVKSEYGSGLGHLARIEFRKRVGKTTRESKRQQSKPRKPQKEKKSRESKPKQSRSRGGKSDPVMEFNVLAELFKDSVDGTPINDLYKRLSPKVGPGVSHNAVKRALDNLKRDKRVQKVGKDKWVPVAPSQLSPAISEIVGSKEIAVPGMPGFFYEPEPNVVLPPVKSIEVIETKVTLAKPSTRQEMIKSLVSSGKTVSEINKDLKASKFASLGPNERKWVK